MINMPTSGEPAEREPVRESVEESAQELSQLIATYMPPAEQELAHKALQLARETCAGVRGSRPIPPLEHALAIAIILAKMHIDTIGVSAGLIFEAVDADLLPLERVEEELGEAVARVVDSMQRMNILERKKQSMAQVLAAQPDLEKASDPKKQRVREYQRRRQAETVRKMFFAMSEDPRVVLLKLAYRLHAMRVGYAKTYAVDQQELLTMARETQEIYAPLAGRLGMSRLECELEDMAFAVLEPEKFAWLQSVIEAERKQWRAYVDRICTILRDEMRKLGLQAEVSGRVKHLYSFYKKLKRTAGDDGRIESLRNADFSQIHDLIAFRILVETTADCYLALGHVHSLWRPKEGRIKDFIAMPRPNGYQSLHTSVISEQGFPFEVQIRTEEMHRRAEEGIAAHWKYKEGRVGAQADEHYFQWMRQLLEVQQEVRDAGEFQGNRDVLQRRHGRNQMKRLEDDADMAAAKARQRVLVEGIERCAVDHHLSAVRTFQSRHYHQQRGFSRARRADQADRLARSHPQADILQDMNARSAGAEREVDVGNGNGVRRNAGKLRGFDATVHGSVIWHFVRSGREAWTIVRALSRVDGRCDDRFAGIFAGLGANPVGGRSPAREQARQDGRFGRFVERGARASGHRFVPGAIAKSLERQRHRCRYGQCGGVRRHRFRRPRPIGLVGAGGNAGRHRRARCQRRLARN